MADRAPAAPPDIRPLPDDEWESLKPQLRAYARSHGVPRDKIDDLLQETWLQAADPEKQTGDPTQVRNSHDRIWSLFRNAMWKDRVLVDNNLVSLSNDPDDRVMRSAAAIGPSPEEQLVWCDLESRAPQLLREEVGNNQDLHKILDCREAGISTARDIAAALDKPVEQIYDLIVRLRRCEAKVAKKLHFEGTKPMFAAGLPEPKRVAEAPARRNGSVWTHLFVASYLAAIALCAAGVVLGYAVLPLVAAAACTLLLPPIWALWFYASWRAIPPELRQARGRNVSPADATLPLFVPIYGFYWLFKGSEDLCEAIDFASPSPRAPTGLVLAAACLTVIPPFVVGPFVWARAMQAIDGHTATILAEWHNRTARDAARFGRPE